MSKYFEDMVVGKAEDNMVFDILDTVVDYYFCLEK